MPVLAIVVAEVEALKASTGEQLADAGFDVIVTCCVREAFALMQDCVLRGLR